MRSVPIVTLHQRGSSAMRWLERRCQGQWHTICHPEQRKRSIVEAWAWKRPHLMQAPPRFDTSVTRTQARLPDLPGALQTQPLQRSGYLSTPCELCAERILSSAGVGATTSARCSEGLVRAAQISKDHQQVADLSDQLGVQLRHASPRRRGPEPSTRPPEG